MVRNPYAICEGGEEVINPQKWQLSLQLLLKYQMKNINSNKDILFFSYEDLCETQQIQSIKLNNTLINLTDINTNQKSKLITLKQKNQCITN